MKLELRVVYIAAPKSAIADLAFCIEKNEATSKTYQADAPDQSSDYIERAFKHPVQMMVRFDLVTKCHSILVFSNGVLVQRVGPQN